MIIIVAKTKQNRPANAIVVNFGVSFRHLNVTENTANPNEDVIPNANPIKEVSASVSYTHLTLPTILLV